MEPEYEPQMRSKHTHKIIEKNVVIFLMDSSNDVHLGGRGGSKMCALFVRIVCVLFNLLFAWIFFRVSSQCCFRVFVSRPEMVRKGDGEGGRLASDEQGDGEGG